VLLTTSDTIAAQGKIKVLKQGGKRMLTAASNPVSASAYRDLQESFLQPEDAYTPIPFWFWNDQLEEHELIRQIRDFKAKGVMGFVIHPRLGVPESIAYLSDTYMHYVEIAVQEAEQQGMIVILYDEAMYPSGSAMGKVVMTNPQYASRGLTMVEYACTEQVLYPVELVEGEALVSAQAIVKVNPHQIDPYQTIILHPADNLVQFVPPDDQDWFVVLFIETFSRGTIRGIHFGQDDREPGAPPSADLLNPAATDTFIRLTYDRYYERLKPYYGRTIQAMFTDEPNMLGRCALPSLKPWTYGFLAYCESFGFREEELTMLWLDGGEGTAAVRHRFGKVLHARLCDSYYRPLSEWCERHGVQLTGHPGGSDEIGLLRHFHLPGQDVVWRYVEPAAGKILDSAHSTLAKCASDSARHRGRRRNANECFGACGKDGIGWNLTQDEMKWYMDWLFVRGTNLLIPHAFYYSISGERVNERPPDVGPNNIGWEVYQEVSQYIRRMSWLMTDSVNVTNVTILCEEDSLPWRIAKPLYEQQIEFNYLEEELFVSASTLQAGSVSIAEQIYRVIIIESLEHLQEETILKLQSFLAQGGQVVVLSDTTTERNAVLNGACVIGSLEAVTGAIDAVVKRDVRLQPAVSTLRISHVRKGAYHFFLVVNEGEDRYDGHLELGLEGKVEQWNPWLGSIQEQPVERVDGQGTRLAIVLDRRESMIYCVDPTEQPNMVVVDGVGDERNVGKRIVLDTGWNATCEGTVVQLPTLTSWTAWPGMEHYSGTVVYEHIVELTESDLQGQLTLNLGEVSELAEVYVNDHCIGTKRWSPYRISHLEQAVQHGRNKIQIRVTNSLANAYNHARLPSGLLGPVELIQAPFFLY
jgi:hypothetical protein